MSTPSTASSSRPDTADRPTPEISVIIVSWNACKFLEECLDSLSRGVTRACEVIVVDNASKDGSPEMVAAKFPWVRLIQSGANLGFAKGNNLGFEQVRGRYVCLVNSDVNVFAGCLDALADYLDRHPDVGMVGPRIIGSDRAAQNTCRNFPNLWNKFCTVTSLSRVFPKSPWFSGEEMRWFDHRHERSVDALVGCFIMTRLKAVEQFGLLDPNFFMYGEDIDWGRRCQMAGWKVMFFPGAESLHYGGASAANDLSRFYGESLRAEFQLWAKHRSVISCGLLWFLLLANHSQRACRELIVAGIQRRWAPERLAHYNGQKASLRALFKRILPS